MSPGSLLYNKAVSGGAQALGRKTGSLADGFRADLIVLQPENPGLLHHGPQSLLDAMVFGCNTNPVKDVMVGGDWKIKDGRHTAEEIVLGNYREALSQLIN